MPVDAGLLIFTNNFIADQTLWLRTIKYITREIIHIHGWNVCRARGTRAPPSFFYANVKSFILTIGGPTLNLLVCHPVLKCAPFPVFIVTYRPCSFFNFLEMHRLYSFWISCIFYRNRPHFLMNYKSLHSRLHCGQRKRLRHLSDLLDHSQNRPYASDGPVDVLPTQCGRLWTP